MPYAVNYDQTSEWQPSADKPSPASLCWPFPGTAGPESLSEVTQQDNKPNVSSSKTGIWGWRDGSDAITEDQVHFLVPI